MTILNFRFWIFDDNARWSLALSGQNNFLQNARSRYRAFDREVFVGVTGGCPRLTGGYSQP
jgi:hypothetical protein